MFFFSPSFSELMSKGKKGGIGALRLKRLLVEQHCALILPFSAHNQQRKEQRERRQWLPNEQQDSFNVLMFPYDQNMDLLGFFLFSCLAHYRNHWQILPQEQLAANGPSSEEFFFEGN